MYTVELFSNANTALQTAYGHIPKKANDEANSGKVVNALSTKDKP
jgi:hypothetical protein